MFPTVPIEKLSKGSRFWITAAWKLLNDEEKWKLCILQSNRTVMHDGKQTFVCKELKKGGGGVIRYIQPGTNVILDNPA